MNDFDFSRKVTIEKLMRLVKMSKDYTNCTYRIMLLNTEDTVEFSMGGDLYEVIVYVTPRRFSKSIDFDIKLKVYFSIKYFDKKEKVYLPPTPVECYIVGNTRKEIFNNKEIGGFVESGDCDLFIERYAFDGLSILNTPTTISIHEINTKEKLNLYDMYKNCRLAKIRVAMQHGDDMNDYLEYRKNGNQIACINRMEIVYNIRDVLENYKLLDRLTEYRNVKKIRLTISFIPKYINEMQKNDYYNTVQAITDYIVSLGLTNKLEVIFIPGYSGLSRIKDYLDKEKQEIAKYFEVISQEDMLFEIFV